jgi:phage portal protein BeeE
MAIEAIPGWVNALKNGLYVNDPITAYEKVPVLYRAVNLRADALSSVPYKLVRNNTVVEWPFKTSLPMLIRETERSLLVTGAAYWLKLYRGRVLVGFQYLNPQTMRVHVQGDVNPVDPYTALRFEQRIDGRLYATWGIDDIVYFREPSLSTDLLPGLAPASVALTDSQVSFYIQRFTSAFFEHGAQPITIMSMPVDMAENEFKRFSLDYLNKFTGWVNAFRTLFVRGGDVKAQTITPPIKDLLLPELNERVTNAIGGTFGVPRTMLEASAANYATANSDRAGFWRETIIPRVAIIEQIVNEQVLYPLGYELIFTPEALDVMQADEAARAQSLVLLTQAGIPLPSAMRILGYDEIDNLLTSEIIDNPSDNPGVVDPEAPTSEDKPNLISTTIEDEPAEVTNPPALLSLAAVDLMKWEQKAVRRFKTGEHTRAFSSNYIPAPIKAMISAKIADATSADDIKHIFTAYKAAMPVRSTERRLFNKLVEIMAETGDKWAKSLLNDDIQTINFSELIKPPMVSELTNIANLRLDTLGEQTSISIPDDQRNAAVNGWLESYYPTFAADVDKTTNDTLAKAVQLFRTTPGMTIADVKQTLTPAFGEQRAAAIAITELTRAQTQATAGYKSYMDSMGIKSEEVWNTDADEIVCVICRPFDNKTRDVWGGEYPDGSPAHPNCRCDITLRLVR